MVQVIPCSCSWFHVIFLAVLVFSLPHMHRNEFFGVERTSTDIHVFGMIVDNSVSTNTVVYVSTVAFCYSWEFFRQNVSVTKKAMDLEKSLLTSKLELLKSQINTHFLFNTLHTISSLVVRQQNEEANKMLVRLSELLRFALKENKDQLIPLHKELELLNLYLDIQKIRFKDRLQINMNVQQGNTDAMVPALLLQPIVENAVKYGIEPYSEKGYVDIDITSDENQLSLTIKDSGKKSFEEINFDSGIGLTNTKDRLEKLYNGKHQFSIHPNSTTGVAVSIQIPKHAHAAFENPNS
jgi:two-component system, LytTR family, sensor kinase